MPDAKTTPKVEKSETEWRSELTPMQYAVLREKATERPFSGEYEHEHREGTRSEERRVGKEGRSRGSSRDWSSGVCSSDLWRSELTPMQYAVLREKATERPFSGEYEHEHREGT